MSRTAPRLFSSLLLTACLALAPLASTVAADAANFAGKPVAGPLTAFAQAEIIKKLIG